MIRIIVYTGAIPGPNWPDLWRDYDGHCIMALSWVNADQIDLIYEGITTRKLGIDINCKNQRTKLTWFMKGLRHHKKTTMQDLDAEDQIDLIYEGITTLPHSQQ